MTCWPLMNFQPINLFNAPVRFAHCKHTHWATYVSWKKRTCVDCGLERPLYDIEIQHQR
jgi:hypothetical protein